MGKWYLQYNGTSVGPMDKEQLRFYNVDKDSLVWQEGMEQWSPIYTIPELMEFVSTTPGIGENAQQRVSPNMPQPVHLIDGIPNDKSKVATGILAILLGGLGIQYFYLGKVGAGFITILLSLVTCGLWEIITLIQGIVMLTMTDQVFYEKYVATNKTFPLF